MAHVERIHRLDGFVQSPSVVEEFLHFTDTVFPALVANGGKFAREGVEASGRHQRGMAADGPSDLYGASNVMYQFAQKESQGSDILLLTQEDAVLGRRHPAILTHTYYSKKYPNLNPIFTKYFVYASKLLAWSLTTTNYHYGTEGPASVWNTQFTGDTSYRENQSVSIAIDRDTGFERGAVNFTFKISPDRIHTAKGASMLVGEEEWSALHGLYAPAQQTLGQVSPL
jgi:hypothetical protein